MTTDRRATWFAAAFVVAVATLVALSWDVCVQAFESPESLRRALLAYGDLAPLVSVFLSAAQVVVAPIPGQLVGVANGYLYGVSWGLAASMSGLAIGSWVAMLLGRSLGRPLVERLVPARTLARLDAIPPRRAELVFFLIFLLPALPDDVACFAIGLSPALSLPRMLVVTVLGRLPGTLAACFLGAYADELPLAWLIGVVATCAALGLGLVRYGDRIEDAVVGRLRRIDRTGDPDA